MLNAHNAFICPRRQNMSPCPCSVAGQVLILVCEYQVLVNINISDIPSRPNLWSATRHHLTVPRFRLSTFGRRAFSVAGPTVWNSLPDSLRDPALTSNSFRQSLKTNLFRRYHSVHTAQLRCFMTLRYINNYWHWHRHWHWLKVIFNYKLGGSPS